VTPVVVGIAGGIGAGKTAVVQELADQIGAVTAGFGDFVRAEAARQGTEPTRDNLQALGERLKAERGDDEFTRAVIGDIAPDVTAIVDGVRHVEIADAIQRLVAPRPFFLVFLDVSDDIRASRTRGDRPSEAERLTELADHPSESQVRDGRVRARADLVVDATAPVADVVARIVEAVPRGK
jgi:dephospho-CoA kinase